MPLIQPSNYKPFTLFKNGHFNTIYAASVKQHPQPKFERERLQTPDDDFFDIDWLKRNSNHCVVLIHGFMGSSNSSYVRNSANYFYRNGYDVCAINCRSASGEPNKKVYTYHAGFTDDIAQLVRHLQNLKRYNHIIPMGFSLGGSILLNYLCRVYDNSNDFIRCAAAISAPLKLIEGAFLLSQFSNSIYMYSFRSNIQEMITTKKEQLSNFGIDVEALLKAKNFFEVDNLYTAKVFNFKNALDYYEQTSALQYLPKLGVPTFLLNAKDDMMLGESSYPTELAKQHDALYFESSDYGGHLGFNQTNEQYYNERIAWFMRHVNHKGNEASQLASSSKQ